eukprot:TRINITY_DN71297_c0_g1_i1.p1 TRINITY_DN71297_c0_g1~~TRINITY_DN71297_c0_g1_i1.p1  ORF type:complete len:405 (+),score=99.51 TRINITY_DN71297_c0_g1_i1:107-1321(+)
MFARLKEQATAAASVAAEKAKAGYEATKERVEVGMAGRKLLEDGGPQMEQFLLAKKASRDSIAQHEKVLKQLIKLADSYAETGVKLENSRQSNVPRGEDDELFDKLAPEYTSRYDSVKVGIDRLKNLPNSVSVSAVEKDAISILAMKSKAGGVAGGVGKRLSAVGADLQRRASATSGTGAGSSSGLTQAAQDKAKSVLETAKGRVGTAKSGKQIVDESTPEVKAKLLAKKACIDTTSLDASVRSQLASVASAYDDAALSLREAASLEQAAAESPAFLDLVQSYEVLTKAITDFLAHLPPAPDVPSVSLEEKDAITILATQLAATGIKQKAEGAVHVAQEKATDRALGSLLSKATGGYVTEAPKGAGKAAAGYAREHPEHAKQAMAFAAEAAATASVTGSGSKGA